MEAWPHQQQRHSNAHFGGIAVLTVEADVDIGQMAMLISELFECQQYWYGNVNNRGIAISTVERYSNVDSGGMAMLTVEAWQCQQQRHGNVNSRGMAMSTVDIMEVLSHNRRIK
ncbi:hypothetical protein EV426DRAFT_711179 [Tirmania nivea]|nr:hypothetical protein EV426DRAFT_711179 [Tirmania nivea]